MKIKKEQLSQHLKKNRVFLISGSETLLVEEVISVILEEYQKDSVDVENFIIDPHFNWSTFLLNSTNLPLFSDYRIIKIRLPQKLNVNITTGLLDYLQKKPEQDIAMIISEKLEATQQKSAWFQWIEKQGLFIPIYTPFPHEMPSFIKQRLKQKGLDADEEAIKLLYERTQGNLLATQQAIEKLALTFSKKRLTLEDMLSQTSEAGQYDVFSLTDSCLKRQTLDSLKILNHLKESGVEPSVILWAITRLLRQLITIIEHQQFDQLTFHVAAQKTGIFSKQQASVQAYLAKTSLHELYGLLKKASLVDQTIKGALEAGDSWQQLIELVSILNQHHPLKATILQAPVVT